MTIRCVGILGVAGLLMVSGCARQTPVLEPAKPATVTAAKWFSVNKKKFIFTCKIDVNPDKHPDQVKVQLGSDVAWLVINACDSAADVTLTFYRKGTSVAVEPINFQPIANGVLQGTVKNTEDWKGTYKYSVTIGQHRKDPEIIIF